MEAGDGDPTRIARKTKLTDSEVATGNPPKRGRGRPALPVRLQPFAHVAEAWLRERPDLDMEDLLLALALIRTNRLMEHSLEAALKKFEVSIAEMRILFALRRMGYPYARRPTDLYRALFVTSGAISKQVNALASRQLVSRTSDPLHAGGFLIHLTAKGLKVANALAEDQANNSILGFALAKLDPEKRRQGIEFVEFLLSELEARYLATD